MDKIQIYIFIGIGAVLIFVILIFAGIIPGLPGAETKPASITLWGFQEPKQWEQIFQAYKEIRPNIAISYQQKKEESFEQDLLNALARGQYPDIVTFPSEYLQRQGDKIALAPVGLITERGLQEIYLDAAKTFWVPSQQTARAIPLYGDALVLYSNKALLTKSFIPSVPKTWDELVEMSKKITVKDASGSISVSGVALGRARNINNAPDIVSTLLLQFGDPMTDDRGQLKIGTIVPQSNVRVNPAESALRFFTDFANPAKSTYSWSFALPEAQDFFITGKLAFYIGYMNEYDIIRAKNPHLDFVVSLIPQLTGAQRPITGGSLKLLAVPRAARNPIHAWDFIRFATEPAQTVLFANATNTVVPRRDIFATYQNEAVRSIFAQSLLALKLWDNPSPSSVDIAFRDMIEDIALGRRTILEAINKTNEKVNTANTQ